MIIPARRFMWLAAVPFAVILGGRGEPGAVVAAWIVMGLLLVAFVVDGLLAGTAAAAGDSIARRPGSFTSSSPTASPGSWRTRASSRSALQLSDRVPDGARAEPPTLEVNVATAVAHDLQYELVPSERGMVAFGDLDYRIRGPLGLAWSQKRLPARLEIRCLPHLANAKAAELAERRALLRQAGSHRYRWRGAGTAFESLREYSTQDDIRWVDWKATARLGPADQPELRGRASSAGHAPRRCQPGAHDVLRPPNQVRRHARSRDPRGPRGAGTGRRPRPGRYSPTRSMPISTRGGNGRN